MPKGNERIIRTLIVNRQGKQLVVVQLCTGSDEGLSGVSENFQN